MNKFKVSIYYMIIYIVLAIIAYENRQFISSYSGYWSFFLDNKIKLFGFLSFIEIFYSDLY